MQLVMTVYCIVEVDTFEVYCRGRRIVEVDAFDAVPFWQLKKDAGSVANAYTITDELITKGEVKLSFRVLHAQKIENRKIL